MRPSPCGVVVSQVGRHAKPFLSRSGNPTSPLPPSHVSLPACLMASPSIPLPSVGTPEGGSVACLVAKGALEYLLYPVLSGSLSHWGAVVGGLPSPPHLTLTLTRLRPF